MTTDTKKTSPPEAPHKSPDMRLPKWAVGYVDALLETQRDRFQRESEATAAQNTPWPSRPDRMHLLAEGDNFMGSGWGALETPAGKSARRWMARLGTVMLAADLQQGARLTITGGGFMKRRFVRSLTVWIDDVPVTPVHQTLGLRQWAFEGTVPALEQRPFHILRLQTNGLRPNPHGPDGHASLSVAEIRIEPAL